MSKILLPSNYGRLLFFLIQNDQDHIIQFTIGHAIKQGLHKNDGLAIFNELLIELVRNQDWLFLRNYMTYGVGLVCNRLKLRFKDFHRKRKTRNDKEEDARRHSDDSFEEDQFERADFNDYFWQLIRSFLTKEQFHILQLHYKEGMKYKEIATLLKISEGTVTNRIHQAKQRLRKSKDQLGGFRASD